MMLARAFIGAVVGTVALGDALVTRANPLLAALLRSSDDIEVQALRPVASRVGPQLSINCPSSAVRIAPGADPQAAIDAHPNGTTFCLGAGVHRITRAITPKTGDTFIGEFGAVLDGSRWTTGGATTSAFRAHNENIDDVTIRNLVIRNMPGSAIAAFHDHSDRWTIDHNELAYNKRTGIAAPNASVISNNFIHHNVGDSESKIPSENGGGYTMYKAANVLVVNNEIAYNGAEQKALLTSNVTFRGNYVHHNLGQGIWLDGENPESLVEGNLLEDNGLIGIKYEVSTKGIIRNNVIRRSGLQGIFIVVTKDLDVYGNTIEESGRGIGLFLHCPVIGGGVAGWDLANVNVHDNTIRVGTKNSALAGAPLANSFTYDSSCTSAQLVPYLNGSKNIRFSNNRYVTPLATGRYWQWAGSALLTWSEWRERGHDTTGTIAIR